MLKFESINPATEERITVQTETSLDETMKIIENGHRRFHEWRRIALSERIPYIQKMAAILRKRKVEFGALMAREMGKPVLQGIGEAEKCAWLCDYYSQNADKFLSPEPVETDAVKSYMAYEPLGIILGIMPWNFPFWQVFRFIVPAMLAGNAAVLKPAPNVSECAKAILSVIKESGLPEDLFQIIYIQPDIIAKLIEHPYVQGITLTGSTRAGKSVAAQAGACMKKTVMELGGSDPYIILEDANLDLAVEACVASRLINTGQSCISAKRFIVVEPLLKHFEEQIVAKLKMKKMGDPMDPTVEVGPLARIDLRDNLHRQVTESIRQGARLLLGGSMPERKGFFYSPTVLTGVQKGMTVYHEETFGPVASVIAAKDEIDAIRIANDTAYGLGAAVFTANIERGERLAAKELFAGSCFVNAFVKSDPRLPFGGIKESGYGRELSPFGIREFVNIKTVFIK